MKEKLSLLDVCKLPDVQLHSRKALIKTIIAKEPTQTQQMKEQIISLSYTVKTIGVQGEEVGISSKRVPLKLKKKQEYKVPAYQAKDNFLPHNSFYAQALVPVKKIKDKIVDEDRNALHIATSRNANDAIHIEADPHYQTQQLKPRNSKSMSTLRTARYQRGHEQNIEQFGKIKGMKRASSALKKKSYSGMLKQCTPRQTNQFLNPINHEQNPLFKKIKRITSVYPTICLQPSPFICQREKTTTKSRGSTSSNLLRHYREQLM